MTETIEDLFKETNAILRQLQRKGQEEVFNSRTCLVCCGRLFPTAESFWLHLNDHTVEQVQRLRQELLKELYMMIKQREGKGYEKYS